MNYVTALRCVECGEQYAADRWRQECTCGGTLFVEYNLEKIKHSVLRADVEHRPRDIWRYRELLPVTDSRSPITLGEGSTPLLHLEKTGKQLGVPFLFLKDEGRNPTGTFKDRGTAVAMEMACRFGIRDIAIPTMGSGGASWAAYGAAAGIRIHVSMPKGLPPAFEAACRIYGAELELFDGDFSMQAGLLHEEALKKGWASATTLREPYRQEGKKTLLFELAEHFGWQVPDVVLCPTGGGVQVIAMWKAYQELLALGWVERKPLRLVAVQAAGVAPITRAWETNQRDVEAWGKITTEVPGFMVRKPKGGALVLKALADSNGAAIAIPDPPMFEMVSRIAREEGLYIAPEGAAAVVAAGRLAEKGFIQPQDRVVAVNTATGLRYAGWHDGSRG